MNPVDKENNSMVARQFAKPKREPFSAINAPTVPMVTAASKGFRGLSVRNVAPQNVNVQASNVPSKPHQASSKPNFEIYSDNDIKATKSAPSIGPNVHQKFTVYRDCSNSDESEDDSEINQTELKRGFKSATDGATSSRSVAQTVIESKWSGSGDRDDEEELVDIVTQVEMRSPNIYKNKELLDSDPNATECSLLEYTADMYKYLRELELRIRPKANYMSRQPDITHLMRSILVDWLVEVCQEYNMETETLFLAVSFLDRFLSSMSVQRNKLQLVGTATMFIASKYEEIYPPELNEFVYITDDTYSKQQVLRMEHLILKALSFDLTVPTINYFVQRLAFLAKLTDSVTNLARYLCELSLMEGDPFLHFLPSEIASSAVALSNYTFGLDPWPPALRELSGYLVSELDHCVVCLHKMFADAATYKHQAIREKYKTQTYNCVSLMTPPPLTKV